MRNKIRYFVSACFDGVAVVILVTGTTLIVALHAIFLRFNGWIIALYVAIALVAIISGWIRIWDVYKKKMALDALSVLLEKARTLPMNLSLPIAPDVNDIWNIWSKDVEAALNKYLGHSYVLRFRVYINKSNLQNFPQSTLDWGDIQARLVRVEEFIVELSRD